MTLATRIGAWLRDGAALASRLQAGLRTYTTEVDGFSIAFDAGGATRPEPILMLHGFSADRDVFRRFAAGLGEHCIVIPDLPGHGRTPFTEDAGYSAPRQADRMLELMSSLGIERFHVIGNSMGGFIAATMARRAPERIISLGLIDAAGVSSPDSSELGRMLEAGRNPFLMEHPSQFDEFFALTMARTPFIPGIVRRAIAEDYVSRRAQLTEIFDDFNAAPDFLDDHLTEITTPTWIGWGARDQILDVSGAHVWADGLPDSRLTIYDELGHMPMLEAPRRSARDYRHFLEELGARQRPSAETQPIR